MARRNGQAAAAAETASVMAEEVAPACPVFLLRADKPGHLHALMAALEHLRGAEAEEARGLVREFEIAGAR